MKTNRFFTRLIALIFCGAPLILAAQQDPMANQYIFNGQFLNPAYAGSHPYANVTLLGRKQWAGFNGAPFTSFLSFDKPFLEKHIGIGFLMSNDVVSVTTRTQISTTLAYHLHLSNHARLSGGISVGMQHYAARLTKLAVWDQGDEVFNSDIAGKILPVAGAGLYFYTERFYTGLSIPNVLSYKPGTFLDVGIANEEKIQRQYYFTAGYAIPAGKNIDIKPTLLLKYVPKSPLQADVNVSVLFYKTLWIGAGYRMNDGLIGVVEYSASKNLRIGYSYEMGLNGMQKYNSGSHTIMLSWDFVKTGNNDKQKTIRFF